MTDDALLAKKLAFIETCVADLRRLARADAIATDLREERFVEHTLQLAIQAVLDVAFHIVSDERWENRRRIARCSTFSSAPDGCRRSSLSRSGGCPDFVT